MKRFIPFIILALIAAGCGSSKKQMESGNYAAAIDKAVKELRKNPNNKDEAIILVRSYEIANEQDNERLRLLKTENRASSYDEIYLTYKRMYDRQALVRTVSPINTGNSTVDFPYVDYMAEMITAKRNAADFYYANGVELMKSNNRDSYRQAYYQFVRAKEYVGDYPEIDNLIYDSKYLGMSRALVSVQNKSIVNFPPEFTADLLALDLPSLNSEWVEYHTEHLDQNIEYDYLIYVNIKNVIVSPDESLQRDTLIKREVSDGFSYKMDARGNVMKDSLGNDIKIPKYKTLQCALIETVQLKRCRIEGDVEIVQINPSRVLKRDPIGAESNFSHVSSRAIGDANALTPEQLQSTKIGTVPFPLDIDMVVRSSETLKLAIRGIMLANRRYVI